MVGAMAVIRCRGISGWAGMVLGFAAFACRPAPAEELDPAMLHLTREVTAVGQKLERLADPDDVLDSLHFGWSDEPYGRATLACATKTMRILEREISLRRAGSAALRDAQVREVLDWLRAAPARAQNGPHRGGFLPHRQRVSLNATSSEPPPALFGFVDRATVTRLDDWYADADLLAACGFKVIARADRPHLPPEAWRSLVDRAEALRLVVVRVDDAGDPEDQGPAPAEVRCLRPCTLREWLSGQDRTADSVLIDPPHGETWGESLARRGLYRGATGGRHPWVNGWAVPEARSNASAAADQVRAAMWVHALDGQRLGLLEGWRDLRDGSVSPYASLAAAPAVVKAVALTALDLLYFDPIVRSFSVECPVALVVDEDVLDSADPNRWSPAFGRVAQELFDANVRFDVLPRTAPPEQMARYALACQVKLSADGEPRMERVLRLGRAQAEALPEHESVAGCLGRLAAGLPDQPPVRLMGSSEGVFCRSTRSADGLVWVAVVNVKPRARRVSLVASGGVRMHEAVDYIDGSTVKNPSDGVDLAAYQVRLLALKP